MPRCSFCKQVYEWPKGLTFVKEDSKVFYFCSSKCKRNFRLGRDPKKVNWVKREKKGRIEKEEENSSD